MTYAYFPTSTPTAGTLADFVGRLPATAARVDAEDVWVTNLHDVDTATQQACGWFGPIGNTQAPADTATTTHDRDPLPQVTAVDPYTVEWTWTERPKTQAELDAEARQRHRQQIDQAITDAITLLENLAAANPLPTVPAGTMNTATLSDVVRTLRNEAQATRAGAQQVATTLRDTIRLVRGDFDAPA